MEFSKIVSTASGHHKISANKEELKAICARLGLCDIEHLNAELEIEKKDDCFIMYPNNKKTLKVHGKIDVAWTQKCVATLEDIDLHDIYDFVVYYVDGEFTDEELDDMTEQVDAFVDLLEESNKLDIAELIVQEWAVNLDPYLNKENLKNLQ